MSDVINEPSHYAGRGTIEQQEFNRSNRLSWCEGNIVKYVIRYRFKGTPAEDIQKALRYLTWAIEDSKDHTPYLRPFGGITPTRFFYANPWLDGHQRAAIEGIYNASGPGGVMHLMLVKTALLALLAEAEEMDIQQDESEPDYVHLVEEERETCEMGDD